MRFFIIFILFFIGCSDKKYFQAPSSTYYPDTKYQLKDYIKDFNNKGAILYNQEVFTKKHFILPDGYTFLNIYKNKFIAVKDKTLFIKALNKKIVLEKRPIAASIKNNIIAILFKDNSASLYDITKNQIVAIEYFEESLANDHRITNPIFLNKLVLIPTLDGKVAIFDIENKKLINRLLIDDNKFNNITFMQVYKDYLLIGTNNTIVSFYNGIIKEKNIKNFNIKFDNGYIYLASIDGTIYKFNLDLEEIKKKKFKYAKIYTLATTQNYIYAVERSEYLIQMDKDLNVKKIYDFYFSEDDFVTSIGNKIFYQDEYIILK